MTTLAVDCTFAYPGGFRLQARFDAGPGVTAVVGPSGGGKSTLLGLIAGLLQPESGSIAFAGRTFANAADISFLPPNRRGVGVVFQDGRLFPHLSVQGNLLYGRKRSRAVSTTLEAVVAALDLGNLLGRRPGSLSGGQQQRVALGRALLTGADLLLLDEPVSALDAPLRDRVLDFVRETVAAAGATCLVVTHDGATASRLTANATIVVRDGSAGCH